MSELKRRADEEWPNIRNLKICIETSWWRIWHERLRTKIAVHMSTKKEKEKRREKVRNSSRDKETDEPPAKRSSNVQSEHRPGFRQKSNWFPVRPRQVREDLEQDFIWEFSRDALLELAVSHRPGPLAFVFMHRTRSGTILIERRDDIDSTRFWATVLAHPIIKGFAHGGTRNRP